MGDPLRSRVSGRIAPVATSTSWSEGTHLFFATSARVTTTATDLPSGESRGVEIRTIFSRSSTERCAFAGASAAPSGRTDERSKPAANERARSMVVTFSPEKAILGYRTVYAGSRRGVSSREAFHLSIPAPPVSSSDGPALGPDRELCPRAERSTTCRRHPRGLIGRSPNRAPSPGALWTGRSVSALAVLFLALDALGKLLEVPPVRAGTAQLGFPASIVFTLGVILSLCVVAYAIPKSSVSARCC